MSKNDKIFTLLTVLLAVVLITKSLYLDEVKNLKNDELKFKRFVKKAVDEKYDGFLQEKNLVIYRIVKLEKTSSEGISTIEYYDENNKKYQQENIQGKYKAKVRGYFLQIIPYKEFYVTTPEKEET